ncbi:MAG: FlgD immunoglobulin-like domain containing protein [Bacteroidota bacterium]
MVKRFAPVILLLGLAAVVLIANTANAQCTRPVQKTWLIGNDNGTGRDTLWFGFHPTATYGLNTPLCEIELPPKPPVGVFDFRFVNIPSRGNPDSPAGLGQGFPEDYRAYVGPAQADTHKLSLQEGVPGGYPFTVSWVPAQVASLWDSAVIQDEFGGFLVKVDMKTGSSAVVTNPAIGTLLVLLRGQKASSVEPVDAGIPGEFGLFQNYPNPFNPATTIRFAIERTARTEVGVYDILGRQISVLASEQLSPGFYNVKWNGANGAGVAVASGTYFVRMSAVDESGATFTAMRKLVLMK